MGPVCTVFSVVNVSFLSLMFSKMAAPPAKPKRVVLTIDDRLKGWMDLRAALR